MSEATETVLRLLEALPKEAQGQVVEQLRIFVQEAQDEARWNRLFASGTTLVDAARAAREATAAGLASDMDYDRL